MACEDKSLEIYSSIIAMYRLQWRCDIESIQMTNHHSVVFVAKYPSRQGLSISTLVEMHLQVWFVPNKPCLLYVPFAGSGVQLHIKIPQ